MDLVPGFRPSRMQALACGVICILVRTIFVILFTLLLLFLGEGRLYLSNDRYMLWVLFDSIDKCKTSKDG